MNGDYIINKTELGLHVITDKDGAIVYIGDSFEECADEIQSGRLDASLSMCDTMCNKKITRGILNELDEIKREEAD